MAWKHDLSFFQLVKIKGASTHLWPLTSLPSSNDWCSKNKFIMKKTAEHQFINKIYNCLNKIYILNCYYFEVLFWNKCKMLKNTKLRRFILYLTKKMWLRHEFTFNKKKLTKCEDFASSFQNTTACRWYVKKYFLFITAFAMLQPEFQKCWDVFKIWVKWKLKDFQITWANILFTIEHREHNKCLRPKTFVGCPWSSGPQTILHHSSAWFCHWHY